MPLGFGFGLPLAAMLMASSTPAVLFANGESGVWISPSDISTLYQDSAGTIPVTAFGQPVGLGLDKSGVKVLGPELITNGDFATDLTGWTDASTAPATVIWSAGAATWSTVGGGKGRIWQSFATVIGTTYVVSVGGSDVQVFIGSAVGTADIVAGASNSTRPTFSFVAVGTTTWIGTASAVNGSTFDTVSVRAQLRNGGAQATAGKRPIYCRFPAQKARNLAQYSSDLSNAYWTKAAGTTVALSGNLTPLGNPAWLATYSTLGNLPITGPAMTVAVGDTFRLSFVARAGTMSDMPLRFLNGDGTVAGSSVITPTASWVRYSISATCTVAGSAAKIVLRGSFTTTGTIEIGDIQLERGSLTTAYHLQSAAGIYSEPLARNLLTYTEALQNAAWTATTATVTPGAADPAGGTSAFTVTATAINGQLAQTISGSLGATFTYDGSVYLKRRTGSGTVSLINPNNGGVTAVAVTKTWTRFDVAGAGGEATNTFGVRLATSGDAVDVYQPQFERGTWATGYQTVGNAYDVTEAGLTSPPGLYFDPAQGMCLQTLSITPGTDTAQVFAGLRKLSDAAQGMIAELSAGAAGIQLAAPQNATPTLAFGSRGSLDPGDATVTGYPAPTAVVMSGQGQISTDTAVLRVNGAQVATQAGDQGTGNYAAGVINIGARSGTSLFGAMVLNEFFVRFGPALSADRIAAMDRYTNSKTAAV